MRVSTGRGIPSGTKSGSEPRGFRHLPIELFSGPNGRFIFDARKVAFIEVDEPLFSVLGLLREEDLAPEELTKRLSRYPGSEVRKAHRRFRKLQKDGYLVPGPFRREPKYDRAQIEQVLSRKTGGFTVMISTRCNLSCSYCIYGGSYRRFEKLAAQRMSWETAKNMLDFLIRNAPDSESLRLDFFGGEPLLEFALMKRCVEYLKARLGPSGPEVVSTIASNGTILTEEILDFLIENKVYLQFSLDGGPRIHDARRKIKSNGQGTYARVIRNLERIHRRDPNYFQERMRLKCVVSMASLAEREDRFDSHPLVRAIREKGNLSPVVEERHYDRSLDGPYWEQLHRIRRRLLRLRGVKKVAEILDPLPPRRRAFFDMTFGQFMDVQAVNTLYFGDAESVPFRKSCLMGYREGAVYPDGRITVCHKAPSFTIGNVNAGGWDFDRIWELYSGLNDPYEGCQGCFVQRFCDLCFEKLDGGETGRSMARESFCRSKRAELHFIFDTMLRVLARNPRLWTDVNAFMVNKIKEKLSEAAPESTIGRDRA